MPGTRKADIASGIIDKPLSGGKKMQLKEKAIRMDRRAARELALPSNYTWYVGLIHNMWLPCMIHQDNSEYTVNFTDDARITFSIMLNMPNNYSLECLLFHKCSNAATNLFKGNVKKIMVALSIDHQHVGRHVLLNLEASHTVLRRFNSYILYGRQLVLVHLMIDWHV